MFFKSKKVKDLEDTVFELERDVNYLDYQLSYTKAENEKLLSVFRKYKRRNSELRRKLRKLNEEKGSEN